MTDVANGHMDFAAVRASMPMTPAQEEHLAGIIRRFNQDVDAKYRKGQRKHGGDLFAKPGMLAFLREECLDFVVYADTLQMQISRAVALLRRGTVQDISTAVRVLEGLTYAGPEAREAV